MASKVKNETRGTYAVNTTDTTTESDDACITRALEILERRLIGRRSRCGAVFETPTAAGDYCRLRFAAEEREHFSVLFLDTRHRLIQCETLSVGTIDAASVYPREVVKRALALNAAAIILTHNHPSGIPAPSNADAAITRRIADACALVDVRVLDHLVVGEGPAVSLAALGMM